MKSVFKLALNLILRTVLVCLLSFMAIITLGMVGSSNGQINPIVSVVFGLIYFFMLFYFFVYTAWVEGGKDSNRVAIGQAKEMLCKGFIAAGITVLPIVAIFIVTNVFDSYQNSLMNVLNIIKFIFMWAGVYLTVPFTGGISTTTVDEGAVTDPQTAMLMTVVLCAVYIVSAIGAGVGYIFGYRKISFIPALVDRIMGRTPKKK